MKEYFGIGDTLFINGQHYKVMSISHGFAECLRVADCVPHETKPVKIVISVIHNTDGKIKYLSPAKRKLLQFFLRVLTK